MTPPEAQVVVIAKSPVAGRVKTRLSPPYSPSEAAELAAAALRDTLAAVAAARVRRRVLALDGPPLDEPPPGFDLCAQCAGSLDVRIDRALLQAYDELPVPVLLVGMDTPQVTAEDLDSAVATLLSPGVDAVLGPAVDGGFWALGLRRPRPGRVRGVPMSRGDTGARQLASLRAAGLQVEVLQEVRDVDDVADARAVALAAPGGDFARAVRRIGEWVA